MRVLTVGSLYPPHHLGGYELVWQAAVRALRDAGHEVRVLCTTERLTTGEGQREDGDVHRELGWYWRDHDFPAMSMRARWALERRNRAILRRHLDDLRPDVVSWWAMGGMSLSLLGLVRRAGIPALAWVNDDWLVYGPHVDAWARTLGRLRGNVDHTARYVFCSQAIREDALRQRPSLADTAVLHQGVSADFTPAPEQPWDGRLIYAGRLDERKGLLTLADAVAAVPEVTLRVVGGGDERFAARLCERLGALGAADRVRLEPFRPRPDLARAYAQADAVVFPVEWREPWGLVPLEAMAVGRPVIATGRGGSGEYLEHERNALLFPAGDRDALAGAIRRLAADPQLRTRLREGGLETAARLTERRWADAVVAEHESRMLPR